LVQQVQTEQQGLHQLSEQQLDYLLAEGEVVAVVLFLVRQLAVVEVGVLSAQEQPQQEQRQGQPERQHLSLPLLEDVAHQDPLRLSQPIVESLEVGEVQVQPQYQRLFLLVHQFVEEVGVEVADIKQPHLQTLLLVQLVVVLTHTQLVEVEQLD
jgi:hypothetical protein